VIKFLRSNGAVICQKKNNSERHRLNMNFFEIIYEVCCEILGGKNAFISKSQNIFF
jgi:hypothetical protein